MNLFGHARISHPPRPPRCRVTLILKVKSPIGVVEKLLGQFGMTSSETVNLLFAEIDRRKAIPFTMSLEDNSDIAPPVERVVET